MAKLQGILVFLFAKVVFCQVNDEEALITNPYASTDLPGPPVTLTESEEKSKNASYLASKFSEISRFVFTLFEKSNFCPKIQF